VSAAGAFENARFPRSNAYDGDWVARNQMGPNVLWLTEWLSEAMELQPGMKVLDLGCGRALSSIFLAREFGATVFATDLWIPAAENLARIREAGCDDRVFPFRAEAHALPFAEGFFDAIVSLDSYHYYGTDDLYAGYVARYLRPGGRAGIVVPGLTAELDAGPPEHLQRPQANGKPFWEPECFSFHSAAWWRRHWERSGALDVESADDLDEGWEHWADHERALEASGFGVFPSDEQALREDAGRTITLVRVVARRPASTAVGPTPHAWEPAFSGVVAALRAERD